jgi:hypothetical protein
MKQLIRIPLGIMFLPFMFLAGTWIWLFEKEMNWGNEVGLSMWHLVSGQWDKLND